MALQQDKVELRTLKSYFRYLYGEPAAGTDDTWLIKPWYYAGLLTKNYVFLVDPRAATRPLSSQWDTASAVAIYVNMNGLAALYTELGEDLKKSGQQQQ